MRISAKQERRIEIDDFQGDLLDSSNASPPEGALSADGDKAFETDDSSGDESGDAVHAQAAVRCALTGDSNLVGLRMSAKYLIASPALYLTSAVDSERLVRGVVACQVQRELARSSLDEALRMRRDLESGPIDLSAILLEGAQRELDRLDSGLTLTAIEVRAVGPPRAAAAAFSALQTTRIEQETLRERITAAAHETLADSESLARQALAEAKGLAELRRAAAADADTRIRSTLAGAANSSRREVGERLRAEAWRDILRECGHVHVVSRSGPDSRLRLPTRDGGNSR